MRRMLFVLAILIFGAVAASPLLAEDNPFLGTWKLNVAKSKSDGMPLPKSSTRTVTADGNVVKYAFDGVAADGSSFSYSFSSSFDGKASPITGAGMPGGADSITLKHVNSHKITGISTKEGKEIGSSEAEASKDGKVVTVKTKGKGPDGKEFSGVSVYDKQ